MRLYSADITGSLVVSGSLIVTGSTAANPTIINPGGNDLEGKVFIVTGSSAITRDLTVGDDFTVKDETKLEKEVKIGYQSGETNYGVDYQLNVTASQGSSYSANFDGDLLITGSLVDKDNATGTAGQVLSSTGTQLQWVVNDGAGITGTGTVGNIPKFTASTVLGNSIIAEAASAITVTGDGTFTGGVTSDDLILTAGTLFGAGNTGFSNRSSDTTLYLQMPATGFNITDNALNTRFILSSGGAATFGGDVTINSSSIPLTINGTSANGGYAAFQRSGVNYALIGNATSVTGANQDDLAIQATNSLRLQTGGNNTRLTISSGGNVIVGHTLSVGTAFQPNIQVKGDSASNYGALGVISSNNEMLGVVGVWSNNENSLMIAADPDNLRASSSIVFTNDGTETMRISSGGEVNIKSTATLGILNIQARVVSADYGGICVSQSDNDNKFACLTHRDGYAILSQTYQGGGSPYGGIKLKTSNVDRLTITSGGDVVVNSGFLEINSMSTSTATTEIDKIYFKKSHPNGVSGTYVLGEIRSKTYGGYSGGLNFYTGRSTGGGSYASTFAMAIDHLGQVGIGTESPIQKLDVRGSTSLDASATGINPLYLYSDNGGGQMTFYRSSAYTQIYMSSNTSGNQFYIRSQGSGGVVLATGGTSWGNGSDARLKKNFETTQGLSEVLQIEPIKYHLKTQDNTDTKKLGFKAQNLQTLIPEMILDMDEEDPEDGSKYLGIIPDYLFPVLVKAIQEQQTIIESQKSLIDGLTTRIETLEG